MSDERIEQPVDAAERRAQFRQEVEHWRTRGIDLTTWAFDPDTGALEVGVRTDTAATRAALQQRYGLDIRVVPADVRPAGTPGPPPPGAASAVR